MLSTWLPHCRRAWRKRSRGNAALPDGSDPPPFIAAAALDVANPLHMDGGIGVQFPSLLNSRILRRLDGKRLFHAAAEDRIAVLVLFDKEVFVMIAHKMLLVCIYFAVGGACGLFKRMLKQQRPHDLRLIRFIQWERCCRFAAHQAPWRCRAMILNLVIGADASIRFCAKTAS